MPSPIIYFNGRLLAADEAHVSVFDHGLLYGHGLFETMRAYEGRVFRLRQHLDRLTRGAQAVGIPLGHRLPAMPEAVQEVLRANGLRDARIRITVTIGEGPGQPSLRAFGPPTVIIMATGLQPAGPGAWERGYRAIVHTHARSSGAATAALKSTSFLENLLAWGEAQRRGADEAIILNEKGLVAECSMANVFFVRRSRLVTPALDGSLLPGVTRGAVIELARQERLPVEETSIALQTARQAEEAFLTNSVIEIMPLTAIGDRPIGDGRPGPLTRRLAAAYGNLVSRELDVQRHGP